MINVTERIGELMALKGWSMYELSNQTSIGYNTICDWFNKGSKPTLQNIVKVCEAMQISLEWFFCGGDYKYTEEENKILNDWFSLSDLEKQTILKLMETFKILKTN